MADVVGLDGKSLATPVPGKAPLAILEQFAAAMAGGLQVEKLLIIAEVAVPDTGGKVNHPTWDSDLTIAETVFLLECAKADIFDLIRRP